MLIETFEQSNQDVTIVLMSNSRFTLINLKLLGTSELKDANAREASFLNSGDNFPVTNKEDKKN